MEFDIKKSPLGKLTKKQILDGYGVLKELEALINSGLGKQSEINDLSSRFYTLIPHALGRRNPPPINSSEHLKQKMKMLETLADIQVATNLIKQVQKDAHGEHPADGYYKSLKCQLESVEKNSAEYEMITTYVKNTHEKTTPKIKNIYRVEREGEHERYQKKLQLGNVKLLWHGSRLTNFVGILSQGLRIAPPEAPVSGYRFGKGVYFGDVMSLSTKYCRTSSAQDYCMLLGEVILGKEFPCDKDTYMEKAKNGFDSTKALGIIEPDPKQNLKLPSGTVVPTGKLVDSGHKGVSCHEHQYVVYDVAQCKLVYCLHIAA